MIGNLTEQIRDSYAHAKHCEERAATALSDVMQEDFLRLRDNWLNLARSYEFADQFLDSSKDNNRKRRRSSVAGNDTVQ